MSSTQKFTALHRLLHWLIAMAMPILFITGFLRMYWMSGNSIVGAIQDNIPNVELSREQMRNIVGSIREPMWEWHEIFAHVVIFSFIARIIYMFVKKIQFPNLFTAKSIKEKMQGFTYVFFYLFLFLSAVTGVCIEKDFFSEWGETIETVHKWGIYWFPIFILLHLSGIVIAEFTDKKGIVSKMIGGD
ncbi:MAG: cytochrome b/b6 domain-containing protein [Bacteroidia bacterium]|nr:cytochrome b/b6 domain-containing protein [Bacteroidia bacterium]